MIYELLVGIPLFPSVKQLNRYFYKIDPFPEFMLKGLSIPIDNAGISLLKSMLTIQPEGRPTAAGALGHAWLVGLESDDDQDDEMPAPPPMSYTTRIPSAYFLVGPPLPSTIVPPMGDPKKEITIAVMGASGNTHGCSKSAVY